MSEKNREREYYWITNTQLAKLSSGLNLKAKQTMIKEIIKLQNLAGKGKKLVPVVSLKAIKEFCEDFKFKNPEMEGANLALNYLLSWAENQGGGKQK